MGEEVGDDEHEGSVVKSLIGSVCGHQELHTYQGEQNIEKWAKSNQDVLFFTYQNGVMCLLPPKLDAFFEFKLEYVYKFEDASTILHISQTQACPSAAVVTK